MTKKWESRPSAYRTVSSGAIAFSLMSALSFFLILFHSEQAVAAMKSSLSLCVKSAIPSLFPFMVVSELVVRSGAGTWLGRLCAPLLRRIFGVGEAGGTVILLGTLCGFPVGAKSAASLYDEGKISPRELSRLLCIANQPSSAFVTSVVGISLFGSYRFGLLLYAITLLSALMIGICCRFLFPLEVSEQRTTAAMRSDTSPYLSRLTSAVSGAACGMLTVCAFICFFGTLVACLEGLPAMSSLPAPLSALLVGFFELTGGVARAAACTPATVAAYAAAWCLGWSGLSVHFQIMCLCDRKGVSFRPYFAAKAAQGAINVALLAMALRIWPRLAPTASIPSGILSSPTSTWPIWCALCLIGLVLGIWRRKKAFRSPKSVKNRALREENEGEMKDIPKSFLRFFAK